MNQRIIDALICFDYLNFTKVYNKKMYFLYRGSLITARDAEKIITSSNLSNLNLFKFLDTFVEYAIEDEKYINYIDNYVSSNLS